jgi:pyridoxamine 5'-phosphate oxidase
MSIDTKDLQRLRVEYSGRELLEDRVDADPIVQFRHWLDEALAASAGEPNAATLATCENNLPTARIVLLKGLEAGEFIFYTNYQSRKAHQLEANPHAAMVFWWPPLQRQVCVEGLVSRTSVEESRKYFQQRPLLSRLGSAASPQSQVIGSRQELQKRFEELSTQYPDGQIPCPSHWGGYRLKPSRIEFWQGRESRLHDRIEYLRDQSGQWKLRRLAP